MAFLRLMEPAAERLHACVYGRVQGVNFRAVTRDRALALGLAGWVRNQPDGSVEVTAEGPKAALLQLLEFLGRGPRQARVERVQAGWAPAEGGFARFEIRF